MKRSTILIVLLLVSTTNLLGQSAGTIKDGSVTISNGVSLHYLQSGAPDSLRTLVLIPGWRLPAYLWSEQLKTFASESRVIAIDPRSQGNSTKTTEGNSPEGRARDLHELLDRLHISQPVLVGWSQGAQDVAAYVDQFGPDSVAGAVFVDSPVSIGPAEIEKHQAFAKIILAGAATYAGHPREYSREMVSSIFRKPHPELDKDKLVRDTLRTPTDIGVAMLMLDIFGADRLTPMTRITRPVLVNCLG